MSGKGDGQVGLGLGDVVAEWEVGLADGVHRVQLEHGTTSGKRVVTVDGKEVRSDAGSGSKHVWQSSDQERVCWAAGVP